MTGGEGTGLLHFVRNDGRGGSGLLHFVRNDGRGAGTGLLHFARNDGERGDSVPEKRGRMKEKFRFFVLLGILFSNYSIMALPKGIQVFGPSKLSNAAYGEFMKVVARLITRGTCEKLGIDAAAFTGFQSHLARLVEITKELRQQKETLELNDLDRERDGLVVYLL